MQITVAKGQNAVDVAMDAYGLFEGLAELWKANALNVLNDALQGSEQITAPEVVITVPATPTNFNRPEDSRYVKQVFKGQNIVDLALQEYGSFEGLANLLMLNNVSASFLPTTGQTLKFDRSLVTDRRIKRVYNEESVIVNTNTEAIAAPAAAYWIHSTGYIVDEEGNRIKWT